MKCALPSVRAFIRIVRLVLAMGLVSSIIAIPPPAASAGHPRSNAVVSNLLFSTAGGHVLGFQPDAIMVASGDHMLKVEFEGPSVGREAPVADQPPAFGNGAQPLGKVSYSNLWPGISLTYEPFAGGIAKSTYLLEPGANVEEIRLRYNVPVVLAEDGSLIFEFTTGQMQESQPIAWQEIEGHRVPVVAAFRQLSKREVTFTVGPYDETYQLVIDPGLNWNSFSGGSGTDWAQAIAVDADGNVYIAGSPASLVIIPTPHIGRAFAVTGG